MTNCVRETYIQGDRVSETMEQWWLICVWSCVAVAADRERIGNSAGRITYVRVDVQHSVKRRKNRKTCALHVTSYNQVPNPRAVALYIPYVRKLAHQSLIRDSTMFFSRRHADESVMKYYIISVGPRCNIRQHRAVYIQIIFCHSIYSI